MTNARWRCVHVDGTGHAFFKRTRRAISRKRTRNSIVFSKKKKYNRGEDEPLLIVLNKKKNM